METLEAFKAFASENLTKLSHPSQNKEILLEDINELTDLLYRFLNHEVTEPSLARLKSNFEISFYKINELVLKELPNAIESLATNFESFLRKICFIKYANTEYWFGDNQYDGILKSTLADLISSELPVKFGIATELPRKKYPELLINRTGTSGAILDFVRDKLRNAVHYAKNYTRTQLIEYSNLVIGVYLLAIKDNKEFLKKKFFPEYHFLENILNKNEFIKLNKQYVELFGIENLIALDNVAIEVLDGDKLLASLESFQFDEEDSEKQISNPTIQAARVDSVLNIAKDINRFIVIGEPGSGKTTTLLKIQYEEANSAFKGLQNSRLPVFINANSYGSEQTFKDLIKIKLDFDDLEDVILSHKVVLIIDGLNEISEELKKQAFNELKYLMDSYETVGFILTSRKFGFFNYWGLPIYELKALNETQISQLIINVLGENKSVNLWSQIILNKQIFELCHNPLMLMMVIKVSSLQEGKIPHNKGLLYQLFNETILSREKKLYFTNTTTKKKFIISLSFLDAR